MVFFFSIAVVVLGTVLKIDRMSQNNENRKLAERPSFKFDVEVLRNYPKDYTKYYNDNFGFRNTFVRINFLLKHNILRESPSSQVVLGKNGWLFYSRDNSIEDYRGITHFDDKYLRSIANSYEYKREWLLKQGIKYVLVLAPNKETIYGEWFPDYLNKIRNRSGFDEYTDYIIKNTNVNIIDTRKVLFENKKIEPLYSKTSSQWNDYAAFLVYREIMKPISHWFPKVQSDSLSDFNIKREEVRGGDLAEMIGGADFIKEQNIFLVPKIPRRAKQIENNLPGRYNIPFSMNQDNTYLPRAVVFRDCFFTEIIPYFSEHFQYTRYYWQMWDTDTPITEIINTVRPDIVIEQKVERFLKYPETP